MKSKISIFIAILFVFIFNANSAYSFNTPNENPDKFIKEILIIGNKKTKSNIILRELTFCKNERIKNLDSVIVKCKENLMNTGLFNFVEINYICEDSTLTLIYIKVTERWYLWPMPIFEIADRNLSEWAQKKDISRTNYGFYLRQENFRGRDQILQVQFIYGYTHRIGLSYTIPYLNRKQNIGLSAGLFVTQNHEIAYDINNDKLQFYKNENLYVRKDFSSYVILKKRKGIYNYFTTGLEYRKNRTIDSVLILNPSFFVNSSTSQQTLTFSWGYRHDKRDYQTYALKGDYFEFDVIKSGFVLLKNEPNIMAISAGYRKYFKLNNHFNFSSMVKARLTQISKAPFSNQRAMGYGQDYLRGYDFYVLNGQNYFLLKSQFKYTLMKKRIYKTSVLKSEKFNEIPIAMYFNFFADAGYVQDKYYNKYNNLSNQFQYAYGIGYDYVTYYDLVFRFEYTFNKLHESGLFFRVGAAF